jgi:eukaryotic-like serine/threonine-protein kinase
MPAPVTVVEFFDLVRKSGVLEEPRLEAYTQKLRANSAMPADPPRAAALLVRDGLITGFQAEQILQGKWRRFTIGKYKVLERLGSGGMGSVYLCEHKHMRRRVAVKVLPTAKASDPSCLERFYREAKAIAALDHPNIVHAYDIDQDENLHFIVMEFVDGASLQDIVRQSGPMTPVRAAHYIRQAALGLGHAYERGLIHRDIKPGNLLVDRSGTVKVLDMGLARFFNDEEDILTKKYDDSVLGTADYLAPEQAVDSHEVDVRADIYSLGATFYFLLTGRTPFGDGTVAQKLLWHQSRQPKPVTTLRPDLPQEIGDIVKRMMDKEPDKRYQTPQEVEDALGSWTATPIPPPSDAEMPRQSPAVVALGETATMTTSTAPTGPKSGPRKIVPGTSPTVSKPLSDPPRSNGPGGQLSRAGGRVIDSDVPTVITAKVKVQKAVVAPALTETAPYASVDNDTQDFVSPQATPRPASKKPASARRMAAPVKKQLKHTLMIAGVAAGIFLFIVLLLWLILR